MEIIYGDVWERIKLESNAATVKKVAVSYLTHENLIDFNKCDQLIVNASYDTIASGGTCAKTLQNLFKKGVQLYSSPNFHGKMFLFGKIVIVGSSNISKNSQNNLKEIIQVSKRQEVLEEALRVFSEIQVESEPIDAKFIEKALRVVVVSSNSNNYLSELNDSYGENRNIFLWKLKFPPKGKLLRAYFLALIVLQINKLDDKTSFKLWKKAPNLATHVKEKRIEKFDDGNFRLTEDGLQYFQDEKQRPSEQDFQDFIKALKSGCSDDLPERLTQRDLEAFLYHS